MYPGVWRQGDWVRFSEQGTCVITGRSDATLNRGGVRMGTSELYAVVEEFAEVEDSLVVHLEDDEGGPGELVLFVVADLDDDLRGRIAGALRTRALAAPRAGHDRRRARDPAHADRKEARGAGEADPARCASGYGRQQRRARWSRARSMLSCSSPRRGGEDDGRTASPGAAADRQRGRAATAAGSCARRWRSSRTRRASASCCGTGPRRRRTASSWPSGRRAGRRLGRADVGRGGREGERRRAGAARPRARSRSGR